MWQEDFDRRNMTPEPGPSTINLSSGSTRRMAPYHLDRFTARRYATHYQGSKKEGDVSPWARVRNLTEEHEVAVGGTVFKKKMDIIYLGHCN